MSTDGTESTGRCIHELLYNLDLLWFKRDASDKWRVYGVTAPEDTLCIPGDGRPFDEAIRWVWDKVLPDVPVPQEADTTDQRKLVDIVRELMTKDGSELKIVKSSGDFHAELEAPDAPAVCGENATSPLQALQSLRRVVSEPEQRADDVIDAEFEVKE
jgi:hypothetical protein